MSHPLGLPEASCIAPTPCSQSRCNLRPAEAAGERWVFSRGCSRVGTCPLAGFLDGVPLGLLPRMWVLPYLLA